MFVTYIQTKRPVFQMARQATFLYYETRGHRCVDFT